MQVPDLENGFMLLNLLFMIQHIHYKTALSRFEEGVGHTATFKPSLNSMLQQHDETTQFFGLPPTSPRGHRPDGPKAGHALTFKLDQSVGAGHYRQMKYGNGCVSMDPGNGIGGSESLY